MNAQAGPSSAGGATAKKVKLSSKGKETAAAGEKKRRHALPKGVVDDGKAFNEDVRPFHLNRHLGMSDAYATRRLRTSPSLTAGSRFGRERPTPSRRATTPTIRAGRPCPTSLRQAGRPRRQLQRRSRAEVRRREGKSEEAKGVPSLTLLSPLSHPPSPPRACS